MENTLYGPGHQAAEAGVNGKYLVIIDDNGKIRQVSLDAFGKNDIYIGRNSEKCDIVIPFSGVSDVHGRFEIDDNRVLFADMNSTSGTIVDADGYRRHMQGNSSCVELRNGTILRIQSQDGGANASVMLLYANNKEPGTWQRLPILSASITIGRSEDNDIVLCHPGVTGVHALVKRQGGHFVLIDNHSLNGILVNGQKIYRQKTLEDKDVISILNSTLIYTDKAILYKSSAQGVNIVVRGINKYVGRKRKKILDNVNFEIRSNEFVAIIGGSGAGKTTLMNAVNGFDREIDGVIEYNGIDLRKNFNELKGLIGYVPQEDIIYENLTLRRMLYYTARLKMPGDTSAKEINDRIDQVLHMVELSEHQNTFIRKLSGGQKKRASIAVEMLADPSVFFLDEPTSGLDPGTEQRLMMTLNHLSKTQGKTIIMVTHTTQSLQLCDRIIFMGRGGRLCFAGTAEDAKRFFSTDNLVDIYNEVSERPDFWAWQYRGCPEEDEEPTDHFRKEVQSQKPSRRKKIFLMRQIPILLLRYIELICNDRPRLLLLFLQPIAIAFLLTIVADDEVFEVFESTKSILFSLSCSGIWIGLFNSIQEICKERPILKREYMGNLKLPYYTLSKFFVQSLVGLIQTLLMVLIFIGLVGCPEKGIIFENAFPEFLITVWLTTEAAMALGFVISSLVKSGDKAMTMAPFVLIVQLLFSGILFELSGAGKYMAYVTVSKWSVESLGSIADLNALPLAMQEQFPAIVHESQKIFESTKEHLTGNWIILLGMTLFCAIVCTVMLRNVARDSR